MENNYSLGTYVNPLMNSDATYELELQVNET